MHLLEALFHLLAQHHLWMFGLIGMAAGLCGIVGFAPQIAKILRDHVGKEIGPVAKPDDIRFAEGLPKTRSGKIMRRLLREIVTNHTVAGDVTTLEDMSVITSLAAQQDEDLKETAGARLGDKG